ncbi:translesion error-prone DNA polymerase V subunit UmuC [Pectobacterium atrosepticum]|uniref:translesion error-prone DNA polymerase V subunit UmuC n=1 Tax=Pectobacterium atrosepticum TaxID=29471 RepID=UPI000501EF54|nr:translesion error-prone DNA polymerase V subunit UmuC [Pectobacterium atrosepticum]KFX11046.1 DNA polymerase V subunit UmuC [Pectobacterium atrosepticum]KMK87602.1 DNA polymerase V subunit UmuC [Pectobacterium atrosepticum ICMP 1526]QXE13110.1 translesion error-prone DNA polymerase V subunit UmuC [Pectobacterium atrosepticum]
MFLLADVNSMYASVEQLFRPDLTGKPVIVLSNNDGAIVALNRQAKDLGIKRGLPFFQAKPLIERHHVACFSSNYSLYGDFSARVMSVLESLAPEIFVYSIDEAFLRIDGIEASEPLAAYGQRVRATVLQQTGLTCGIGIAQTLTLAKLANHAAKHWPATGGVVDLSDRVRQRKLMALLPVDEVWGVGRRLSVKLTAMGVKTALQLADANVQLIKKTFGVVLERTVRELNGVPCISVEELPAKQQIVCNRSFGLRITAYDDMRQAICQYAERAAEKLRLEHQYCRHISVFIKTSPFAVKEPYYGNLASQYLAIPTQDTRDVIAAAVKALDTIWNDGYRYAKAGIMLNDFSTGVTQLNLFDSMQPRVYSEQLMQAIDNINQSRNGKVFFVGQGINKSWAMKRDMLSPAYTTSWRDLPKARLY